METRKGGSMWYIIIGCEILTLTELIREEKRGKCDKEKADKQRNS